MRREEKEQDRIREEINKDIKKLTDDILGIKEEIKEKSEELDNAVFGRHEKLKHFVHTIFKIIILLVPVVLISYLLYSNFLSEKNFNYFYDMGSLKESREKNVALSPVSRISNPKFENNTNYRELVSSLVYFDVPIAYGTESIKVQVRFKDDFPENAVFRLGAKDKPEWHYKYKTMYNKVFEKLDLLDFTNIILAENFNFSDIPENSVIATDLDILPEQNYIENYEPKNFTINTSLRGRHDFYVYIKDNLHLEVKKQDINWYNGTDELEISLYDSDNTLIANTTIPDDGIINVSKNETIIQTGILEVENLSEGVYKLEFSDFDGLIREIKLNQDKIIVDGYVFLADNDIYFKNLTKPSELYFKTNRPTEISFKTWHNIALQLVNISIENKTYEINISQRVSASIFYANETGQHEYKINSRKNDIIISGLVYFAFSKESYFEPFKHRVVSVRNNATRIKNNVDYLVIDYKNVVKGKDDNDKDWLIGEVEFDLEKDNLYVKDNKLSMVFNIPHLSRNETQNYTIPIDWINITVHKPGLLKKWGLWGYGADE